MKQFAYSAYTVGYSVNQTIIDLLNHLTLDLKLSTEH